MKTTPTRLSGTVKFFDDIKKWGFITPAGAQTREEDVFVHIKEVRASGLKTLASGDSVEFDLCAGKFDEVRACNIQVIPAPRSD